MDGLEMHSPEAEQAVIGYLVHDNVLLRHTPALKAEHFLNPINRRIFAACKTMIEAGEIVDPIVLKNRFSQDETLADIGGVDYIARITLAASTDLGVAKAYVDILIDHCKRRNIIGAARAVIERASDVEQEDDIERLIDGHIDDAIKIQRAGSSRAVFKDTKAACDELMAPDRPTTISIGLPSLDKIAGFDRGALTIIAGRASMGKSAFFLEAACRVSEAGLRADVFSLEMNAAQLSARIISRQIAKQTHERSNVGGISYNRIYRREYDASEAEQIDAAIRALPALNIDDSSSLSVTDIKTRCYGAGSSLDVVFVDYLNKVDLSDCEQRRRHDQQLGDVANRLRNFAKDTNCAVVLLAQLNRQSANRDNNVPKLHDLRDSGELEQHADTVMFVHREHYYEDRKMKARETAGEQITTEEIFELKAMENIFDVVVAKQRMGPIDTATLHAEMGFNFIREVAA